MEKFNSNFIEKALQYAASVVKGLNYSVCHYHAVDYSTKLLESAGFKLLKETDNWKISPGEKYYMTRNSSALFAFTVGSKVDLHKTNFKIIGTHTDSPNLRLAPNSFTKSDKVERLHLQTYGGGQWQTWFDRDLSLCGKILINNSEGKLESKLVRIDEPLFNIPHLAIHLTDDRNKPFNWNNETHLKVVLSMGLDSLIEKKEENLKENKKEEIEKKLGKKLSDLICNQLKVEKKDILDFDLILYDTNASCIMGVEKEFISSGRLDNLLSTLIGVDSIISASENINLCESINILACFDNEEVGSLSGQGADSTVFFNFLKRVFKTLSTDKDNYKDSFLAACNRSFALSADLSHATHPNYSSKHQPNHKVEMHTGVTLKINSNLRYSTNTEGAAILKNLGKNIDVPIQEFIVNQDSPCGTTIGPIINSNTGIKTVDIGIGCFAMHSIRETASTIDCYHYLNLMKGFYNSNCTDYSI